MEKGDTKQDILKAALDLFSEQGYEATSVAQIAEAVGIQKATIYSHYASKQEILDALTETVLEEYNRHSLFAGGRGASPFFTRRTRGITPEEAWCEIEEHIRYILHDETIKKIRKMLTIEQFRNPKLKEMQTKQTYTDVMQYFTDVMRFLILQGTLVGDDPEIMAAEFCLPVNVWINLCDREPEREREVMELARRYICSFFKTYGTKE